MSRERDGVIRIYLESFDDIAMYMISRATGITTLITILCSSDNCFTIIPLSERTYIHLSSPPPEKTCRFYYIDDSGNVACSQKPVPARTNLAIVRVREVKEI